MKLVNAPITSHSLPFVVYVVKTFKIYALRKFQVYNIALLTTVTALELDPCPYLQARGN